MGFHTQPGCPLLVESGRSAYGSGSPENWQQIGCPGLLWLYVASREPYIRPMTERCWTIDISKTFGEIEQQVIAIVAEMDGLGVFGAEAPDDADKNN